MTVGELNDKDRGSFVQAIGWVFEDSPWVAERAWGKRPFASVEALHESMVETVAGATLAEQLTLLRAHPDLGVLGSDPLTSTGARPLSDASTREQAGAGLDSLTKEELDRLRALNATYRGKFGFPFLYAVKGSTKHDVLNALERRLTSTRDTELQEALRQVYRIARFRLEEVVAQGFSPAQENR
jgi:2-oxo-4-hydroxy-4-carboxy-5-ureidoimidazoline decarboxylase